MSQTVVGLFENMQDAQLATQDLLASGFNRNQVSLVTNAAESRDMLDNLNILIGEPDVRFYQEGVRRGGSLVVVNAADRDASQAANILARYNMVDVDARSAEYSTSGNAFNLRDYSEQDYVLPVVEEELQIGKREVERRRMRVYTRVTETPVEEQVRLREEHINVERRPVDRPVTEADMAAFKEGTIEMTERAEEAVVSKVAHVIEEVVIGKEASEHVETVRDTVRRTDVEVEQTGAQTTGRTTSAVAGWDTYDADFRNYYTSNYANSGYTYEQYRPVLQYGYDIANNDSYRGKDWSAIEVDARQRWEERNPGTWEQFKDSVQYAWQRVRGR
ncbi:YsnF/AvaK domain-containing protein [Candidatus Gracilibacteria bacterium]|nr:YsnF/AvaK domain-containing protein [Candidatus Gracilibacteria bacterium]